jgi:antirestriction protein ArdC
MSTTTASTGKRSTKRKARRKPTEAQIAARKEQADALHAGMVEQIKALADSEQWKKFLAATAAFHTYSTNNVMMILSQDPEATQVCGFKQWKERGRQVRKGEKALKIFGYRTFKRTEKDPATGEDVEKTGAYFPLLSVFDISQTDPIDGVEGADDPADRISARLTGEDPAGIYARAAAFLTGRGWTVGREDLPGQVNGRTMQDGSMRVAVDACLSDAQAAKTLLHEAAHVLLHTTDDGARSEALQHRGIGEVEAESVAYVVAGMLGLDTSAYSIGYVTSWGDGNVEAIKATAERVLQAVHTLAGALLDTEEDTDGDSTAAAA